MTVAQLQKELDLKILSMPLPEKEVSSGYTGDLLSFVMGTAQEGDAWVTIMSNLNIVAVATLTDVACVILAAGVTPDAGVIEKALEKEVNILSSPLSAYELCAMIAGQLS
ncbi:MAG: hypothetical protein IJX08_00930 [Clostridia bacterium]|nr:hypothetical protein [Clostridia bacterium]